MDYLDNLIQDFRQCAIDVVEARYAEKYRLADRLEHKSISLFDKILACGNVGRERLFELVLDVEESVRLYAASCSLHYAPKRCLEVLEDIAKSKSRVHFDAECVVEAWVAGKWQLGRLNDDVFDSNTKSDNLSETLAEPVVETIHESISGTLEELLKSPPQSVKIENIGGQKRFIERASFADLHCNGCIEFPEDKTLVFRPDDTPPPKDHLLAWIWSIRPDLGREIAAIAGPDLSREINEYIEASDLYE